MVHDPAIRSSAPHTRWKIFGLCNRLHGISLDMFGTFMESWNDTYSVGVREMDEQHKRLLGYIGALGELLVTQDNELIHELLARITDYGQQHFEAEERLLAKHGFPLEEQRAAHERYIEWMAETNYEAVDGTLALPAVYDYLRRWWTTHILGDDMQYKEFLNSRGVS